MTLHGVRCHQLKRCRWSGAYVGSLAWTLGGFANALATSNGGVLKVTVANAATTVTADTIAIDASNSTGTNALELTLTNTAGSGVQRWYGYLYWWCR